MSLQSEKAAPIIHSFAAAHGVVALTLANTLVGDTAILTVLTGTMVVVIARLYNLRNISGIYIVKKIFLGLGWLMGTYLGQKMLFFLPGIGNFSNMIATIVVTEAIGWTAVTIFETGKDPESLSKNEWKQAIKKGKEAAEKNKEEAQKIANAATDEEKAKMNSIIDEMKKTSTTDQRKDELADDLRKIYDAIKKRIG